MFVHYGDILENFQGVEIFVSSASIRYLRHGELLAKPAKTPHYGRMADRLTLVRIKSAARQQQSPWKPAGTCQVSDGMYHRLMSRLTVCLVSETHPHTHIRHTCVHIKFPTHHHTHAHTRTRTDTYMQASSSPTLHHLPPTHASLRS